MNSNQLLFSFGEVMRRPVPRISFEYKFSLDVCCLSICVFLLLLLRVCFGVWLALSVYMSSKFLSVKLYIFVQVTVCVGIFVVLNGWLVVIKFIGSFYVLFAHLCIHLCHCVQFWTNIQVFIQFPLYAHNSFRLNSCCASLDSFMIFHWLFYVIRSVFHH